MGSFKQYKSLQRDIFNPSHNWCPYFLFEVYNKLWNLCWFSSFCRATLLHDGRFCHIPARITNDLLQNVSFQRWSEANYWHKSHCELFIWQLPIRPHQQRNHIFLVVRMKYWGKFMYEIFTYKYLLMKYLLMTIYLWNINL